MSLLWLLLSSLSIVLIGWVSIAVYGVWISPMRHIPGDLISQVFPFYDLYFMFSGKFHERMLHLHNKHGPIVRLGGDRISISSQEGWKELHSTYRYPKSSFYEHVNLKGISMVSINDRHEHITRRRVVGKIFNENNTKELENIVKEFGTESLVRKLKDLAAMGSASVDMSELFNFLTVDVIGMLLFGKNLDIMKTNYHPMLDWNKHTLLWSVLNAIFPPIRIIGNPYLKNIIEYAKVAVNERRLSGLSKKDILGGILEAKDPYSGEGLSDEDILEECAGFLIAGSDSTSHTLTWILYSLLKNPVTKRNVETEIRSLHLSSANLPEWKTIQQETPLLNAVIKESMRILPVAALPLLRKVPLGGAKLHGYHIPQNTEIFTMNYVTHHLDDMWSLPKEFLPERWLEGSVENEKLPYDINNSFLPFSTGPRACPGRHLAMMELGLTLVSLITEFDIELVDPNLNLDAVSYLVLRPANHKPLSVTIRPRI